MRHLFHVVILLMFATAAPLAAQETEATDTSSEDAAQSDTELSMGEPVGPQVGEPFIREQFGDWALRCVKAPEGQNDRCNLYQLLMNDEGVAVAEFNIFPLPEGVGPAVAGARIVVPLETLLTQQLTLAVDGANARRYPFTFCNQAGCVARIGFTAEEVEQFKRGANASLRLVPAAAPNTEVLLDVSLSGFTAGFESSGAQN